MKITPAQLVECHGLIDLASLDHLEGNPHRGNREALRRSLDEFGQFEPIVVWRGQILIGNHRADEAAALGLNQLAGYDLSALELGEAQRLSMALASNRIAQLGYDDPTDLAAMIAQIDNDLVNVAGFDDTYLADLTATVDALEAAARYDDTDPDDTDPTPPAEPDTKAGDVWLLGRHILVCGDATDIGAWSPCPGPGRVLWTDPPYGLGYEGKTAARLTIDNDTADGLADLLAGALGAAVDHLAPGANTWVASPPGPTQAVFAASLAPLGMYRQHLVWVKDAFVLGHSDYHYQHESICYGWVPGAAHHPPADRLQTSVLEFARPKRSTDHPTMKPVPLIAYCLSHSAPGLVIDPFAGSGSTMAAAELAGRPSFNIEKDPGYCDVIRRRWETLTGGTATRR